jgi:hypothetical protein
MNLKAWKIASLITVALLLAAFIPFKTANAAVTKVRFISSVASLGPDSVVGQRFKVAVVVENITDFYGFDIQLNWDTTYIRITNETSPKGHNVTVPSNTHPAPNSPSPYIGALKSPTLEVKNIIDESENIPDANPEAMAWFAYASMLPALPQNGSATIAVFEFEVIYQPIATDANVTFHFLATDLANSMGTPIANDPIDLDIPLYGMAQPAAPTLKIEPATYSYEGSTPHQFDVNISLYDLDAYWDLGGFDIQLSYDTRYADALSITKGPFLADFNFTWVIRSEINDTTGIVWLAYMQYPTETHEIVSGDGLLFTITFEATTCTPLTFIRTESTGLAGYPHPERPEHPYHNSEAAVVIPYTPEDGVVKILAVNNHTITLGGVNYIVNTRSNSSVALVASAAPAPLLTFTVAGPEQFTGFCNVTIPKALMWSDIIPAENGWVVQVDGQTITPQITTYGTNTYIYFTYSHSTHNVSIIATGIVPEIGGLQSLTLILIALAMATFLTTRFSKRKNI